MRVFISHKQEDIELAKKISFYLNKLNVSNYLDELDHYIYDSNKDLTNHIKEKMNNCSDLLVVMTENTKDSWWVPFEIGMAAQKNYPTVTFKTTYGLLPDYLSYWPKISSLSQLDLYVTSMKKRERNKLQEAKDKAIFKSLGIENFSESIDHVTNFYQDLKQALHQN